MRKVEFQANVAKSFDELIKHILSAYSRGLPQFRPTNKVHLNHAVICGSGPTVKDFVEDIREHKKRGRNIVSLNAAHDFLISHGVIPNVHVSVDPRARIIKGFRQPRDDILYLIASQCHPGVFEHLKNYRVYLWNSYSEELHALAKDMKMYEVGLVHIGS